MKELVTEEGAGALAGLVGARIMYGLAPDASLTRYMNVDGWEEWRGERGLFVTGHVVVLRVEEGTRRRWVTLSPGPDAPIDPWAPMWATCAEHLDAVSGLEPHHLHAHHFEGRANGLKGVEFDTYMDTHADGLGMMRLTCWTGAPVRRVEVHDHAPYAALVVEHTDGMRWSCWAEYDFAFWLSFTEGVADALEEPSGGCTVWDAAGRRDM